MNNLNYKFNIVEQGTFFVLDIAACISITILLNIQNVWLILISNALVTIVDIMIYLIFLGNKEVKEKQKLNAKS